MIAPRFRSMLLLFTVLLVPTAYWLRFAAPVNGRVRDASGGAAYVLFWSALVILLRPTLSILRVVFGVFCVTCALEFLQLWHPWLLEAIRRTLPGRLILGTTFDPFDFPPYVAGAIAAAILLPLMKRLARDGLLDER